MAHGVGWSSGFGLLPGFHYAARAVEDAAKGLAGVAAVVGGDFFGRALGDDAAAGFVFQLRIFRADA